MKSPLLKTDLPSSIPTIRLVATTPTEHKRDSTRFTVWNQPYEEPEATETGFGETIVANQSLSVVMPFGKVKSVARKAAGVTLERRGGQVGTSKQGRWLPGYEPFDVHVQRYLESNPDLRQVLLAAVPVVSEMFGSCKLTLAIVHDPDDHWTQLFALIHTQLAVEDAVVRLKQFDQTWFLDQRRKLGGRLNFDINLS